MKKKMLLGVIIIVVMSGSFILYLYYKNTILPKQFVKSFLKELEFKGAEGVNSDYFISDYFSKPQKTWEEYYLENKSNSLTKEQNFLIWKEVYLSYIKDYVIINIDIPYISLISDKDFANTYKHYEFNNIEIKYIEINEYGLLAVGTADIKADDYYTNLIIGGLQKFKLYAKNGDKGWKIMAFALNIPDF